MKLVINRCYGGYSLSARAVARMAEIQGRPCFLFLNDYAGGKITQKPATIAEIEGKALTFFSAFDIEDPDKLSQEDWAKLSMKEREASNSVYERHSLSTRPEPRNDPILVRVVEELGALANGPCAQLAVVEIPDGVEFEIEEYDGIESVHEVHRSWR